MPSITHRLGGLWFFFIGAPLAAWFVSTFFLAPYLGYTGYTLNLATVLALANPLPVLIFVALWLGFSLAYFGGDRMYRRHSSR